ncbi:MAG TPA: SCO family protein [Devosia sp.]|nr:SCO family protein [Devosia sp.]
MAEAASPGLARFRMILWILVAVAALAATAIFVLRPPAGPLAVTGQPFALQSTQGGTFTEKDLVGKPSMVFFGYTNCPDVCPTTLADTVAWKRALGVDDSKVRTIFVTVDPERDTLPVVTQYLAGFDPNVIGLVGSAEETKQAEASFGATSSFTEKDATGFYLVNHTASVFLIDANGRFQSTIAYQEPIDTATGKLKRLIGG